MSKPSQEIIDKLKAAEGDDESYHVIFDDAIEAKLMELDPEWMKAMKKIYEKSDMARWCA